MRFVPCRFPLPLVLSLVLASCIGFEGPTIQASVLPSTLVSDTGVLISGPGTGLPVVQKLAEAYDRERANAKIEFATGISSGGALRGSLAGNPDLAAVNRSLSAEETFEGLPPRKEAPSFVNIEGSSDGSFRYMVNGQPQVFIGMGYNPIYRHLSDEERAARYDRDFRILCQAGVNHIIGWDADKGYEQDKFDELTLDYAHKYGLGVVMPFYLPPEGDYEDQTFLQSLPEEATAKVERFKRHPALRMWGVGNEVLTEIPSLRMRAAFGRFYLQLADLFHSLDPDHPVIYREAEDQFVPAISRVLSNSNQDRPWLLYGMNVYSLELERFLDAWPSHKLNRPLFVTEFGAEPYFLGDRALGYLTMWRMIRAHPGYVLGGAPYVWTTEGPEPTDPKWGLMDAEAQPVDGAFDQLAREWLKENSGQKSCTPSLSDYIRDPR